MAIHILSFSLQSCIFVQCCPRIILLQCRGNLCNVGATFEAAGYYQKINMSKIKIAKKGCCSETNTLSFFLYIFLSTLLGITQSFKLCNVVPTVLGQYWTVIFPVQCCLEPLEQHSTRILLVQCYPISIKTTLNSIFSCAMLSQASWTTLHKDFTCAICTKGIETTLNSIFSVQCCLGPLGQNFTKILLCNVVPRVLRQHWRLFFPVQFCLEPLRQHSTRISPVQCCPKSIKTSLNRIFV